MRSIGVVASTTLSLLLVMLLSLPAHAASRNNTASVVRLSIPSANDTARAAHMSRSAGLIANGPRSIVINGTTYTDSDIPALPKNTSHGNSSHNYSSLYEVMLKMQTKLLNATQRPEASDVRDTMTAILPLSARILENYHLFYKAVEVAKLIEQPDASSMENGTEGDRHFGMRRLHMIGHRLELVRAGVYTEYLEQLNSSLVSRVCAQPDIKTAVAKRTVFVANFDAMGQYTDEQGAQGRKYAPDTIGFFCVAPKTLHFLPLAIHLKETGLLFTRDDSTADWTLAKMALDATELNHMHVQHIVEVHKLMVPIQVEMIRSLAPQHPVHALLQYHMSANFALENRSIATIFSAGSDFDKTFAFGAAGAMRFAGRTMEHRVDESFRHEMQRKGLDVLVDHRLIQCGLVYSDAITSFVRSYIQAFYTDESAIRGDQELQRWAAQSSKLRSVRGFPKQFTGFADLTTVLANLVFQCTVRHFAMHGPAMWHSIAAPFSTPALWNHTLPKAKGTKFDPLAYAIPLNLVPALSAVAASAAGPAPPEFSMLRAYNITPFSDEPKLAAPIAMFQGTMQMMESLIGNSAEAARIHMRPSQMPVFAMA